MKKFLCKALLLVSFFGQICSAEIIDNEYYITDTSSGLDWYKLSYSRAVVNENPKDNLNELLIAESLMSENQKFYGWRPASLAEIHQLIINATGVQVIEENLVGGTDDVFYSFLPYVPASTFIEQIGVTESNEFQEHDGGGLRQAAQGVFRLDNGNFAAAGFVYYLRDTNQFAWYERSESYPSDYGYGNGVWLVRDRKFRIKFDIPTERDGIYYINGRGSVRFTFYGVANLDVSLIDVSTLLINDMGPRSRGNGVTSCIFKDANRDGFNDLVCIFELFKEKFDNETMALNLTGSLITGGSISERVVVKYLPRRNEPPQRTK